MDPNTGASSTLVRTADPRGLDVAADGTIYGRRGAEQARRPLQRGRPTPRLAGGFGDPYDVDAAVGVVYVVDGAASGVIPRIAPNGTTVTIPTGSRP